MLWTWPTTRSGNLWNDVNRLHQEMNRLFEPFARARHGEDGFPAVNIRTAEDDAVLTAEIPGVDPESIEVTVKDDTVTIRGKRESEALKDGESYLRHERGGGRFVRSFSLPFPVDSAKVAARYRKGILELTLPRSEEDKPRKIEVHAA